MALLSPSVVLHRRGWILNSFRQQGPRLPEVFTWRGTFLPINLLQRPLSSVYTPVYTRHFRSSFTGTVMNIGQGQAHESHFGPPSESIQASKFLEYAAQLELGSNDQPSCQLFSTSSSSIRGIATREPWSSLSPAEKASIETECRCVRVFLSAPSKPEEMFLGNLSWVRRT